MTKRAIEQKKIALPVGKWNELKEFSVETGIPMAQIVTRLWDKYKKSPAYAKTILLGKDL